MDFREGPVTINMIEYNLYLGGSGAAKNINVLNKYKITHILTIDDSPLPRALTDMRQFVIKFIHLSDQPKANLLGHLEETDLFIKEGLSRGAVLVHCHCGVSRSASVIIAYIMKKYGITHHKAFEKVKAKRSIVHPNKGFVSQLILYRKMGYTIDQNDMDYKVYRLDLAADRVCKEKVLPQNFYDLIHPDPDLEQIQCKSKVFRCKKCRRIVATDSNLILHQVKREHCRKTFFIEPLTWMNCAQVTEGTLPCPKCNITLGSFSWTMGSKCPCGVRVIPAFYLTPSKVDYSMVKKGDIT